MSVPGKEERADLRDVHGQSSLACFSRGCASIHRAKQQDLNCFGTLLLTVYCTSFGSLNDVLHLPLASFSRHDE